MSLTALQEKMRNLKKQLSNIARY